MNDLNLVFRVVCAIAAAEALAIVVLAGVIFYLWNVFTQAQKELLDRLMSRNLSEYVALAPAAAKERRRVRALSDAEMADEEERRMEKAS